MECIKSPIEILCQSLSYEVNTFASSFGNNLLSMGDGLFDLDFASLGEIFSSNALVLQSSDTIFWNHDIYTHLSMYNYSNKGHNSYSISLSHTLFSLKSVASFAGPSARLFLVLTMCNIPNPRKTYNWIVTNLNVSF